MESSLRYQLLELGVNINGTPSVALIERGPFNYLIDESPYKTVHSSVSKGEEFKLTLENKSLFIYL